VETRRHSDAYHVLNVRPDAHQVVVRAAFHALAALYHPDVNPSPDASSRMAELNRAYAMVRTSDLRAVYESRTRNPEAPKAWAMGGAAPPPPPARPGTEGSQVIDFGRYEGWRLADLILHDPDYLRWLARHASGVRYRAEIERRLAAIAPKPAAPEAKGRRGWSAIGL
jgi:curved DNA-binding protein CbpA